jgi:LysM repeat protein
MMRKITPVLLGLLVIGLGLSACNRPITSVKKGSATPVPPTLDELSQTRTSIAGPIMATLTAANTNPLPGAQQTAQTALSTQATTAPTSQVVTVAPASPVVKVPATKQKPVSVQQMAALPEFYKLHRGEFPFCLARRFNIDPRQLMCVNGFWPGQVFYAGQVIVFPANPQPYMGRRALWPHPVNYKVRPGDTIYTIACLFGDVDPINLAQVNGLAAPYRLRVGQTLNIP